MNKRTLTILISTLSLPFTSNSLASGFNIAAHSVTGIGRSHAGGSLAADDLSAAYTNPAEMVLLKGTQMQSGMAFYDVSSPYTDTGSTLSIAGTSTAASGGEANAGVSAFIPNAYYVLELDKDLYAGFAMTTPFGLSTDYNKTWIGRYHAVESSLKTVELNPSIGLKLNDSLALGFGISAQYSDAFLTRSVFTGGDDGFVELEGTNWEFGYNVGLMLNLSKNTRFSFSYRSSIDHHIDGTADFSGLPITTLNGETDASTLVRLPSLIQANLYSKLTEQWAIMATVKHTQWSRFDELRIKFTNGVADSVTDESWVNANYYSLGASYEYSPKLSLRFGIAYDETPVPDAEHRTPNIPGADHKWYSFGLSYAMNKQSSIDIGLTHVPLLKSTMIKTDTLSTGVTHTLQGEYRDSRVNIFSIQYRYKF